MKANWAGPGEWKRGTSYYDEQATVHRTLKYPPSARDLNPTLLDQTRPTRSLDVPFVHKGSHTSWAALGYLYSFIWWDTQPKADKKDINSLGELLAWNKALISSFYDRALHPIGEALKLAVRSRDLIILGFPGTTIPGPNDLARQEHLKKTPRVNPMIPVFSTKAGFTNSPVGPGQCVYGKAEFPEPDPPIDTSSTINALGNIVRTSP